MSEVRTVIHRGGIENRYKLSIEEYVLSYLEMEVGKVDLKSIWLYGYRRDCGKRIVVCAAGREKNISMFQKYEVIEDIVCQWANAEPVFLIKENTGFYEIRGYDVFFQDNEEMQSYMLWINRCQTTTKRRNVAIETAGKQTKKSSKNKADSPTFCGWITIQLLAVVSFLLAIVITSTDSYDEMTEVVQATKEILFAMENQDVVDANQGLTTDQNESYNDKLTQDTKQSSLVSIEKSVPGELSEKQQVPSEETGEQQTEQQQIPSEETEEQQTEKQQTQNQQTQNQEALSRSVTRYYEVKRGDTLYTICREIYGDISKVKEICDRNHIDNPDAIKIGQKIELP